jgi:hypothetical protein
MSHKRFEEFDLFYFERFVKKNGAVKYADVPDELFKQYAGVLPDYVLAIWERYGFTHHANGFFWIVDPNDYAELLDFMFGKNHGMTAFGKTSFGRIYVVRNDNHRFAVSAETGRANSGEKTFQYNDHLKALEKLGLPSVEEIYGYVPALALGGAGTLEETQIVGMKEYLLMVAELAIELNKSGWDPFANNES